jgi:hypothetical protein
MDGEIDITPGLQCCLICGRTVLNRELHDSFEEPALAAIRAEHPEWAQGEGACVPCVEQYKGVLRQRAERAERPPRPPRSFLSWLRRRRVEGGGRDGK